MGAIRTYGPGRGAGARANMELMPAGPFATDILKPGVEARNLGVERCYALLRGAMAGHLALSQGALPLVVPVTCALDGDRLLVRAGRGHLGLALLKPGIVAFQTAATSLDQGWRWEVLVRGPAKVFDGALSPEQAPPGLPLVAGEHTTVLHVSMELVTGWRYGMPLAPAQRR